MHGLVISTDNNLQKERLRPNINVQTYSIMYRLMDTLEMIMQTK